MLTSFSKKKEFFIQKGLGNPAYYSCFVEINLSLSKALAVFQ